MRVLLPLICVAVLGLAADGGMFVTNQADKTDVLDPRVRQYVMPRRIVWRSWDRREERADCCKVESADSLVQAKYGQVPELGWENSTNGICLLINEGVAPGLVLDFGRELHGGLQIAVNSHSMHGAKIRVRFGESVSEAMSDAVIAEKGAGNDHALRDFTMDLPVMGTRETGNSGFRFVRIDLLTPGRLFLESVRAVSLMRPMKQIGSFRSSDARLNAVFDTAVRTVHLCCQDYLWDGIKRDRLVWVGDMHPEIMTILSVFGTVRIIPETLEYVRRTTRPDQWVNTFPTYTLCWLRNVAAWYRFTGDRDFIARHVDYIAKTFDHVRTVVGKTGWSADAGFGDFLDWPTHHNPTAEHAGAQALALLAAEDVMFLGREAGDPSLAGKALDVISMLKSLRPDPNGAKSAAALLALSGLRDSKEMFETVLSRNGHSGVSTFYGYYMLEAMSAVGENQRALDTIRDYWGAMLDVGATSFWENFDLTWTNGCFRIDEMPVAGQRDVHGDCGEFCYSGFRHSLCHGWSSGPAAWIINNILGIRPVDIGCKRVSVKPCLGDLTWAEGAMSLPDGDAVKVRVRRQDDGSLETDIEAPSWVTVER